jgi:hypothetical protein
MRPNVYFISCLTRGNVLLPPSESLSSRGVALSFALYFSCRVLVHLLSCWVPSIRWGPQLLHNTICSRWLVKYVLFRQGIRGAMYPSESVAVLRFQTALVGVSMGNVGAW